MILAPHILVSHILVSHMIQELSKVLRVLKKIKDQVYDRMSPRRIKTG